MTDMNVQKSTKLNFSELVHPFSAKMEAVNRLIRERMASRHAPRIPEVTAHLVESGGKRLRPTLTLAAAGLYDYEGDFDVYLAATVEFLHTATLLHDDVVDESEMRRGRATANLLWDNKSSVLVGDYLFSRAFQLMVETGSLRVLDILANASGTIAEGEVLQLTSARDLSTDEVRYLQIVRGKTATLLSAAAEVGGVVAEASEDDIDALREYGDALGIAFQIADDLLDYEGDIRDTGKNIGNDFRERKLTLPIIKSIAASDQTEYAFWERCIYRGEQREGDLEHALGLLEKRNALVETRDDALRWADCAKDSLRSLPKHPIRDVLGDLADFAIMRVS